MTTSEEYLSRPWLEEYRSELVHFEKIQKLKEELSEKLDRKSVEKFKAPIAALDPFSDGSCGFSGPEVHFQGKGQEKKLKEALECLIPWRKGPFQYGDQFIDTEWKSNRKWDRIADQFPELKYKKICDVGCNNGYYMYRMLQQGDPQLIWGLDPMIRYYFYFCLNRKFFDPPNIQYDILGVEHLDLMENFFDISLFMGVIYHRRNPVDTLQKVAKSLKSGGLLIMESSGIPGEGPYCLFPEERYLKAPGYWFLPTQEALVNMLKRTGFKDIKVFYSHKLEFEEQRQTLWAPYQSLEHFLDPQDPSKTVEGYPAPIRIYLRAIKK